MAYTNVENNIMVAVAKNTQTLINEITKPITDYVASLEGRFKDHVSDAFIAAFLIDKFVNVYHQNYQNNIENIAYKAAIPLFEHLLEHGCKITMNGHHVAQAFARWISLKIEL